VPAARSAILREAARGGSTFHAYEISGELPRGEAREILAAAILSDVRHFEWSRGENARALVAFASREDQLALWTQVHAIAAELSRVDLVSRLPGIAPLLHSLGGPSVAPRAVQSPLPMCVALRRL
jgi:hypothetical protein